MISPLSRLPEQIAGESASVGETEAHVGIFDAAASGAPARAAAAPQPAGGLRAHVSTTTTSVGPFLDSIDTGTKANPALPAATGRATLFLGNDDMRQGTRLAHVPAVTDAALPPAARGAWSDAASLSAKQILLAGPGHAALSPQVSKASDLTADLSSSISGLNPMRVTPASVPRPEAADAMASRPAFHLELSDLFDFGGAAVHSHPLTATLDRLERPGPQPHADKLVAAHSAAALFGRNPDRARAALSAIGDGAINLAPGSRSSASGWDQERAWQLAGLLSTTGGGWHALTSLMPADARAAAGAPAELRQKSLKVVLQARHATALERNATRVSLQGATSSARSAVVGAVTSLPTLAATRLQSRVRADEIELHAVDLPDARHRPLRLNATFAQKVEHAAKAVWRNPETALDPARPLSADERLVFAWRQGLRDEQSMNDAASQFETAATEGFKPQPEASTRQLMQGMVPFADGASPSIFPAVASYGAMGAQLRYVHEIHDEYEGHAGDVARELGQHVQQLSATAGRTPDAALKLAFANASLDRIGQRAGEEAAGRPRLRNDTLLSDNRDALIRQATDRVNSAHPDQPPMTVAAARATLAPLLANDIPGFLRQARDHLRDTADEAAPLPVQGINEHLDRMSAIERGDPLMPADGSIAAMREFHLKLVDALPMGDRVRWLRGQTVGVTNSRISLSHPTIETDASHGNHQANPRGAGLSIGGGPDVRAQGTLSSTAFVNSGGYGIDWSLGRERDLSGSVGAAGSLTGLASSQRFGAPFSLGARLTSTEQAPTGFTLRARRELDEAGGTRKADAEGPRRGEPVAASDVPSSGAGVPRTEDQYRFEMKRLMQTFFDHAEAVAGDGTHAAATDPKGTFFDQVAKLGMGSDLITIARQDHRFSTVTAEINAAAGVQGRWTAEHPVWFGANVSGSRQVDLLDGLNRSDASGLDQRLIVQSGHSARETISTGATSGFASIPVSSRPDAAVSSVSIPAARLANMQGNVLERGVLTSFRTLRRDGAYDQQQTYRDVAWRTLSELKDAIKDPAPWEGIIGKENLKQALHEMTREDDLNKRYTLRYHATPELTTIMDTYEALAAAARSGVTSPAKAAAAQQRVGQLSDQLAKHIADDRHYGAQGIYAVEGISNRTRVGANMLAEFDTYRSAAGDHETMWIGAGNAAWNEALDARRNLAAGEPANIPPASRPFAEADHAGQSTEAEI